MRISDTDELPAELHAPTAGLEPLPRVGELGRQHPHGLVEPGNFERPGQGVGGLGRQQDQTVRQARLLEECLDEHGRPAAHGASGGKVGRDLQVAQVEEQLLEPRRSGEGETPPSDRRECSLDGCISRRRSDPARVQRGNRGSTCAASCSWGGFRPRLIASWLRTIGPVPDSTESEAASHPAGASGPDWSISASRNVQETWSTCLARASFGRMRENQGAGGRWRKQALCSPGRTVHPSGTLRPRTAPDPMESPSTGLPTRR